jgi:hypothetical protein
MSLNVKRNYPKRSVIVPLAYCIAIWLLIGLTLIGFRVWSWIPDSRFTAASNGVRDELKRLQAQVPEGMRKDDWDRQIDWVFNLHSNCVLPDQVRTADLEAFHAELRKREASLATIDWIWTEYGRFTKNGREYERKHRPQNEPVKT